MFEPVSTAFGVCCVGYAALNAYSRPGSAISSEAVQTSQAARGLAQEGERSQALFGNKLAALCELNRLAMDCAESDWDGQGASPIDPRAVRTAEAFVRALPTGVVVPSFAPEPDGSVSLDWIHPPNRIFSLSIGTSDRVASAWVDGTDRGHAIARFDGRCIPLDVLLGIHRVVGHGNAAFWLA